MQVFLQPPAVGLTLTYAVTVAATPSQAIGIRRNRLSLTFHNPGTVSIYVYQPLDANGNAVTGAAGGAGTLLIVGGGYITIDAPGNGAWNCIAAAPAVLTVIEATFFQAT